MNNYEQAKERLLNSFTTHFYLKDAIKAFDKKDCVDALYNAKALVKLLELKVNN
jgi:hypothetical protein